MYPDLSDKINQRTDAQIRAIYIRCQKNAGIKSVKASSQEVSVDLEQKQTEKEPTDKMVDEDKIRGK